MPAEPFARTQALGDPEMIVPSLGIGKKSHLPVLKILDHSFGPVSMIKIWRSTRGFTLKDLGSYAIVSTGRSTLKLSRRKAGLMVSEWGLWNRFYIPRGGVAGKTVLEVGAGCGEATALLFERGAKSVVCVEPAADEVEYLRQNIEANHWNAEVVPKAFDLSLLTGSLDLVKMDCEGCEGALLGLEQMPNLIAEVHSQELMEGFTARGLRVTRRLGHNTWMMSNV